jgi:hypothetical protein
MTQQKSFLDKNVGRTISMQLTPSLLQTEMKKETASPRTGLDLWRTSPERPSLSPILVRQCVFSRCTSRDSREFFAVFPVACFCPLTSSMNCPNLHSIRRLIAMPFKSSTSCAMILLAPLTEINQGYICR